MKALTVAALIGALEREDPNKLVKFFDGSSFVTEITIYEDECNCEISENKHTAIIIDVQPLEDDQLSQVMEEFGSDL